MSQIRPMKACNIPANLNSLPYPLLCSEKLDGIRCIVKDGVALSNTLKPIRNKYVQSVLGNPAFNGLDGELIVGDPTAKDCMRVTNSGVMSIEGEPNFTYYVFDTWNRPGIQYHTVLEMLNKKFSNYPIISPLTQYWVNNTAELESLETITLDNGYEGLMVRRPDGMYKFGRSTAREGFLYKLKRYSQTEARVVGYKPLYHNANDPETNALGYTQRSAAKEGKIELNLLGALTVQGFYNEALVTFDVGTGFTLQERKTLWELRDSLIGKLVTFKFFPYGGKDAPRHPIFISFRDEEDV